MSAFFPTTTDGNLHASLAARLRAHGNVHATWFAQGAPVTVAVSPGRLDVIGGIADYSGATVLEATIGPRTVVAMHRRDDRQIRITTVGPEAGDLDGATFEITVDSTRLPAPALRERIGNASRWAAYVVGAWHILTSEGVATDLPGADVVIDGRVPLGAGVASSAALEVASMRALCAISGITLDGLHLAALCQMVEQRVAGAPCGIMDQVTCALGESSRLLELRCQPHDLLGHVAIPTGVAVIGLDSGIKHAIGGARYPRVRAAAFMGREILRRGEGREAHTETVDVPGGYLCNLSPSVFAQVATRLPRRMRGREFLARYEDHHDAATTIDPDADYPIRGATTHPVSEQARVVRFRRALLLANDASARIRASALASAGRQMYGAHRSYSRNCGLGANETDAIVALVRAEGPANGLHGAKITGGGSGGTVAVLADAKPDGTLSDAAAEAIERVRVGAGAAHGRTPRIIAGSSPGAMALAPVTQPWIA